MTINGAAAAAPAELTRKQLVGWRNAIFAIFAMCGLSIATWLGRNPAIRDLLHASTGKMGWIVFGLAVGSVVGLTLSSHVLVHLGGRRTILLCLLLVAAGLTLAGFGASILGSAPVVVAGLATFGAGNGMCDVAMNVEGAANERALGRTIMPLFHAAFSGGTMVGAGLAALAEHFGVPVFVHVVTVAVAISLCAVVAVRFLAPHPDVPGATAGMSEAPVGWRGRLAIWKERRTLLIGLIVLGMAFTEGSANDWLALSMVDGHHVSNAAGAAIFGLFVTAMTAGRILGVRALDRFGRVLVLRATAAMAAVGLVMVIFVPSVLISTIGVVLWGLGASLGFPVGMSAAADDPAVAAARVSAVATIGYFAFLVGPPVIGLLGEHFGLLHALLLVLVLVAAAGITSPAAREPVTREPVVGPTA